MRVFQITHKYDPYIAYFEKKYGVDDDLTFDQLRRLLLQDRFYAPHILLPCLNPADESSFYVMWDYERLQRAWAREHGIEQAGLKDILYAQIEAHGPDVFYSVSPCYFTAEELRTRMARNIIKVAWNAAPGGDRIDYGAYHVRLCNLPTWVGQAAVPGGCRHVLFHPAHDPVMDAFACNQERHIDILFSGQYVAGFFERRNQLLRKLARWKQKSELNIQLNVMCTHSAGRDIYPFMRPWRLRVMLNRFGNRCFADPPPETVRQFLPPVFGVELYKQLSQCKIAFNAAVDCADVYRANMRNFEALGCGAHMLSDEGIYPDGFEEGRNFTAYKSFSDFQGKVRHYLRNPAESRAIAVAGHQFVRERYSKENQWREFQRIVATI